MKKNTKSKISDVILHGEAMIFKSKLPKNAKRIESTNKQYHIIADSETTGNHHVIDCADGGVEFYMDEDGTMYMVNEKETSVRCVHTDRHDEIKIETGCWEFGIQQEYDHMEQHLKKVRD